MKTTNALTKRIDDIIAYRCSYNTVANGDCIDGRQARQLIAVLSTITGINLTISVEYGNAFIPSIVGRCCVRDGYTTKQAKHLYFILGRLGCLNDVDFNGCVGSIVALRNNTQDVVDLCRDFGLTENTPPRKSSAADRFVRQRWECYSKGKPLPQHNGELSPTDLERAVDKYCGLFSRLKSVAAKGDLLPAFEAQFVPAFGGLTAEEIWEACK